MLWYQRTTQGSSSWCFSLRYYSDIKELYEGVQDGPSGKAGSIVSEWNPFPCLLAQTSLNLSLNLSSKSKKKLWFLSTRSLCMDATTSRKTRGWLSGLHSNKLREEKYTILKRKIHNFELLVRRVWTPSIWRQQNLRLASRLPYNCTTGWEVHNFELSVRSGRISLLFDWLHAERWAS